MPEEDMDDSDYESEFDDEYEYKYDYDYESEDEDAEEDQNCFKEYDCDGCVASDMSSCEGCDKCDTCGFCSADLGPNNEDTAITHFMTHNLIKTFPEALRRLYPVANVDFGGVLEVVVRVAGMAPLLQAVSRLIIVEKQTAEAQSCYPKCEKLVFDAVNKLLPEIANLNMSALLPTIHQAAIQVQEQEPQDHRAMDLN
jgi:hypothetical protein